MNPQTAKRIAKEIQQNVAKPVPYIDLRLDPDNMLNVHFTFLGPPETPFVGGLYHGVIMLSPEYPHKPPHIQFLSNNGRFELHKNICTTFTAWHPECWLPTWNLANIVTALRSMLDEDMPGSVAALVCTPEVRKKYAAESLKFKCKCCGLELGTLNLFDEGAKKIEKSDKLEEVKAEDVNMEAKKDEAATLKEKQESADVVEEPKPEVQEQNVEQVAQKRENEQTIAKTHVVNLQNQEIRKENQEPKPKRKLRRELMLKMVKHQYEIRQLLRNPK